MKAISANMTRCLPVGARINCVDNSGAKIIRIISVRGFKGIRRTIPSTGIAGLFQCKVLKGNEKVRHLVHKAVIVRQTKEFRRADGTRVSFEDNAAVLVDDKGDPKGNSIKGPIAREVVERFPTIGKIASTVV
ncbi:MAG: 50S ribosomal protein L14 [Candidatus Aenigmatarchaeota archaeon]